MASVLVNIFKAYITVVHESLFIRHRYTEGLENLPGKGEKYIITCNHQNTANDPLNIMFALPFHCRIAAMARANVFFVNKYITKFLHWIGLVPAFRFGWEGENGLENNFKSFDMVAESINQGCPFIVFPEAGHTQGHYLGRFTTGTVRMAFHVAKYNGWKEDIKIVPTAHHYDDYFKLHSDFYLKFSEPISLKPYYERFQSHPNGVMREITKLIRNRIQSMMLDEGEDDYEEKEFLRCSSLNPKSLSLDTLPERLNSDKNFISTLLKRNDYADIIQKAKHLNDMEKALGVDDITAYRNQNIILSFVSFLLLIILLPLWIVCLLPHIICYAYPPTLIHEDKMFTNSYRYILSALGLYPLFALVALIIGMSLGFWWQTLLWLLLWIPCARFAWWYYDTFKQNVRNLRWNLTPNTKKGEISKLRQEIKIHLDS